MAAGVELRSGFDEEGEGEWQQLLCFGLVDGRWRLYLQFGYLERPDSMGRSDLFTSNVDTRLIAAKKVPVLVKALEAVEADRRDDVAAAAGDSRDLSIACVWGVSGWSIVETMIAPPALP